MDRPYQPETSTRTQEITKYLVSAVILGIGGAILAGLVMLKPVAKDKSSDLLVPLVRLYEVQSYAGQLDMEVSGVVVPYREIKIAAEVRGTILTKEDACQAGNFVKKGWPLLKIDPTEYEYALETINLEVAQAERTIEETEEEILGAERTLKLAQNDYEIQEQEFQRSESLGSVLSKSERDQAKRALLNAETQLQTRKNTLSQLISRKARLEASLRLSKSKLDQAQLDLTRTVIKAPDDGVIVREEVEKDDFVSAGTVLVLFEDTKRAEVLCNLTPDDIEWIRTYSPEDVDTEPADSQNNSVYHIPKTSVAIFDKSNPGKLWEGTLERFDGIGRDEMTRTIPVRIVINEPIIQTADGPQALVRGMYVKCRIEVNTSAGSIERELATFPEKALQPGSHIWVVRDMKLQRVEVDVIDRIHSMLDGEMKPFVVVPQSENGLRAGDQVVRSAIAQPTHGATVQIAVPEDPKPDTESDQTAGDENDQVQDATQKQS